MIAGAPNTAQLLKHLPMNNARERARIKRSLHALERRGMIDRQKNTAGETWKLTAKGKKVTLQAQLSNMTIQRQDAWDRLWRIIMFDIPENKRIARRALSGTLKKIGCVHYQKSVFLTPFPCEKEIDFVGDVFKVRKCIRIVIAKKIEGATQFRKHFTV